MTWRIGEILIQKKFITWEQLNGALEEQKKTKELTGEILVRKGFITRNLLYKSLAEQSGLSFVDLKRTKINPRAVEKIPMSIAEKYTILPVEIYDDILTLAIGNTLQAWPEKELRQLAGVKEIRCVLSLPEDIESAIRNVYAADTGSRSL